MRGAPSRAETSQEAQKPAPRCLRFRAGERVEHRRPGGKAHPGHEALEHALIHRLSVEHGLELLHGGHATPDRVDRVPSILRLLEEVEQMPNPVIGEKRIDRPVELVTRSVDLETHLQHAERFRMFGWERCNREQRPGLRQPLERRAVLARVRILELPGRNQLPHLLAQGAIRMGSHTTGTVLGVRGELREEPHE